MISPQCQTGVSFGRRPLRCVASWHPGLISGSDRAASSCTAWMEEAQTLIVRGEAVAFAYAKIKTGHSRLHLFQKLESSRLVSVASSRTVG
jgi:hypothetical protein